MSSLTRKLVNKTVNALVAVAVIVAGGVALGLSPWLCGAVVAGAVLWTLSR